MRFIYFDLGNVLVRFDHQLAARKMAAVARVSAEQVWDVVYESQLAYRYERGEISSAEFHRAFCEGTASNPPFAALYHAAGDMFEPIPGMSGLVRQLRQDDQRLGILSNTCAAHWDYCLENFPWLSEAFRVHTLSFRVRHMKPEPEIYQAAVKLAETPPEKIFFTDDRPENIAGALEAGLDAVLFESVRQIQSELARRGLLSSPKREIA